MPRSRKRRGFLLWSKDKLVFTIKVDMKKVQNSLSDLSDHAIKDASAFALNKLAKQSVFALQAEMKDVFDNPTPFTLNAFYSKPAKPNNLAATIQAKDYAPKGTPAGEYLKPQIFGGDRPLKKFEKALAPLSGGQYAVPGPGARINGYGNMSQGQIIQILSRLQVMRDPSQNVAVKTLNRLRKQKKVARGAQTDYFVGRDKGNGRPTGIYQLMGKGRVVPVLFFIPRAPSYHVRLKMQDVVEDVVARKAPGVMAEAIGKAVAKAFK